MLVFIGIFVLVAPVMAYIIIFEIFLDAPNSGWLMLGVMGAFVVGIGLFNIVAAFFDQYLGHIVTFGALLIGGAMIGASWFLLFDKKFLSLFDSEMVSFVIINDLFLLLVLIVYIMFRFEVSKWLTAKHKVEEKDLNEMKKGKLNFLWYEQVNTQYPMGAIYGMNKLFTVLYPVTFLINIIFGFFKVMVIPIEVMSILIVLIAAIMFVFSITQENKALYGRAIVLARKNPVTKKLDSSVFDLSCLALFAGMIYVYIKYIIEYWDAYML